MTSPDAPATMPLLHRSASHAEEFPGARDRYMASVTKRQIVERIAKQTGQTQAITQDIIQSFMDEIVAELAKGNKLEFRDFAVFEVVTRRSRAARNPKTGEDVFVPEGRAVRFKMGRQMKHRVASGGTDEGASLASLAEAMAAAAGDSSKGGDGDALREPVAPAEQGGRMESAEENDGRARCPLP